LEEKKRLVFPGGKKDNSIAKKWVYARGGMRKEKAKEQKGEASNCDPGKPPGLREKKEKKSIVAT